MPSHSRGEGGRDGGREKKRGRGEKERERGGGREKERERGEEKKGSSLSGIFSFKETNPIGLGPCPCDPT